MSGMGEIEVVDVVSNQTRQLSNPRFLLSENGSFSLFSSINSVSAWEGVYFFDSKSVTSHKVLHQVSHDKKVTGLEVSPKRVVRKSEGLVEQFSFSCGAWCYQARGDAHLVFGFDNRQANDFSTDGRFHDIKHVNKYTFELVGKDSSVFVRFSQPIQVIDDWVELQTSFDKRRQGSACWWVHNRIRVHCRDSLRVVIASSQEELSAAWRSDWDQSVVDASWPEHALDSLVVDTSFGPAILAGYPWFTQVWTRDEAISVGALIDSHPKLVAKILLRQVRRVDDTGRISNRTPGADLGSADGVGWVFTRLHQLYVSHPEVLSESQWLECYHQLCVSLDRQFNHYLRGGLIINDAKETWMDTEASTDDVRLGACIEIQALTLASLQLAVDLAARFDKNPSWWKNKQQSLLQVTRDELFIDGRLYDRKGDSTQRPNAFIALYVYPKLLSKQESVVACNHLLDSLWLSWGGLSTIDTSHPLFEESHTGMHDDSYHRGDSWYWVNALASIVLARHGEEFSKHVKQLRAACMNDLLWMGVVGHPSEISSACSQEAFGCFSQAWSAALLIECLR